MNQPPVQAAVVAVPASPPSDGAKVVGVIGGAIAGGLVAGPIGAIGGAVVGHVLTSTSGRRNSVVSRQIEPPLNIASVDIPRQGIREMNGVMYFTVQVVPIGGGNPWSVTRRYNHFSALRNSLHQVGPRPLLKGYPFPRKYWTGTWGNRLEQRRRDLEVWLKTILIQSEHRSTWRGVLRPFLENGRYQTQILGPPAPLAAPQQVALGAPQPLAQPQVARPVSNPPQIALPPADANVLLVQLPANATPGQLISVGVPDGRQLTVTVPQGSSGGSVVQMRYNPAAGSISPLPAPSSPREAEHAREIAEPQVLQVRIPVGIHSGQLLGVTVPSGEQVNITVPEGVFEGSELTFLFDPSAKTLTHLP